jgi:hypothetical protein
MAHQLRVHTAGIIITVVITALTGLLAVAGAGPASAATAPFSGLVAFEASGSAHLWLYNPANDDRSDTGLGMAPGTSSPAIVDEAGYQVAFQSAGQRLCVYPVGGTNHCTGLGMATGTSPSIAGDPSGGVEVAFQAANTGHLWLYSSRTDTGTDINLGMAADSSPSIVNYIKNGNYDGFQVAFQSNTGVLCVYLTDGNSHRCTTLGMAAFTSPSLGDAADGGVVAFNANGSNDLWLYRYAGNIGANTGNAMAPDTSPSDGGGSEASGIFVAFQEPGGHLYYYDSYVPSVHDSGLGMAAASSPSANPDFNTVYPGGGYETAFLANNGLLYVYDEADNIHVATNLGIYSGTSPAVAF